MLHVYMYTCILHVCTHVCYMYVHMHVTCIYTSHVCYIYVCTFRDIAIFSLSPILLTSSTSTLTSSSYWPLPLSVRPCVKPHPINVLCNIICHFHTCPQHSHMHSTHTYTQYSLTVGLTGPYPHLAKLRSPVTLAGLDVFSSIFVHAVLTLTFQLLSLVYLQGRPW